MQSDNAWFRGCLICVWPQDLLWANLIDFGIAPKNILRNKLVQLLMKRQHSTVVHTAKAILIRDLHEKVAERSPPDTPVPSNEWIHLQFCPSCQSSHTQLQHTGNLKGKHMVQQRQWWKQHEDILIMLHACFVMKENMLYWWKTMPILLILMTNIELRKIGNQILQFHLLSWGDK